MVGLIFELVEAVKLDEQGAVTNHLKQNYTRSIHNRGQLSTLTNIAALQLFHLCTFSKLTLESNKSINTHPKKFKRPVLFFTDAN